MFKKIFSKILILITIVILWEDRLEITRWLECTVKILAQKPLRIVLYKPNFQRQCMQTKKNTLSSTSQHINPLIAIQFCSKIYLRNQIQLVKSLKKA